MNQKAEKFSQMLAQLPDDNVFEVKEAEDDEDHLVLFRSSLEVKKDWFLPMVVFLDDSIYSIIRVWAMTDAVNDDNRAQVRDYLTEMNRRYKVFKYYDTEQGDIVCGRLLAAGKKPCPEMVADAAGLLTDVVGF